MLTFQGTTTYNVNNLNQYTNVTYPRNGSQTETVNFVYDDNGNLLQDDKREYQYDYRNRLIKATNLQNHEIITFKYDILNRRTQKIDRSKSWKWMYSFHDVAEEDRYMNASMTAGAIKVREFVYGNGMDDLVYMEQNKPLTYNDEQEEEGYTEVYTGGGFNTAVKRYFFQKDLAGSTKIVSDIQGKVIEMYAYDSFGRIYERNGISGNYRPFQTSRVNHNRFFTNREYDTDLQFYYYRARWYSPALGRFMSRDPLGYSEGPNLYAYVDNNPTSFKDPWGTDKQVLPEKTVLNQEEIDVLEVFDNAKTDMGNIKKGWKSPLSRVLPNDYNPDILIPYFEYEFGTTSRSLRQRNGGDSDLRGRPRANGKYDLIYWGDGGLDASIRDLYGTDIYFAGENRNLGEISNVLAGLNAQRLGISSEALKSYAMITVKLDTGNGKEGELADQILYDYGYEIGAIEEGGSLDNNKLIKCISKAIDTRKLYVESGNKPKEINCD